MKTLKTYTKRFFTKCILKNNSVKTAFYTAVKNLRREYKKQGRHERSCWIMVIFYSKVINFEHFVQTSTITILFIKCIKAQIWLVQSFCFNVQSLQLSTINTWLPSRWFIILIICVVCFSVGESYRIVLEL